MNAPAASVRLVVPCDPPVPADGTCYVCHRPRKPERSRRYAGPTALTDPFCSNTCARAYYGTTLEGTRESA